MNDLFTYPDHPGFKRTDTSIKAAEDMAPKASTIRGYVLQSLKAGGPATSDEMAIRLSLDKLSVRPRFSELRTTGEVIDTGLRRKNNSGKNAIVWGVKE